MKQKQISVIIFAGIFISLCTISCSKETRSNDTGPSQTRSHAGTTYYVSSSGNDAANGTSASTPWQTLAMVSGRTFSPGDSILFHSGDTFVGQLQINSSGATGLPITYGRYGLGAQPIIDGANAPGGAYLSAIYLLNQQYISITDLEIQNNRTVDRSGVITSQGYGILIKNSTGQTMNYFRFNNLTIRNVFAVSTTGVSFDAISVTGLASAGSGLINDVNVTNCYMTMIGRFGINFANSGGTTNLVISNNHTLETGGSGIQLSNVVNGLMENNIFDYPGSNADPRMPQRGSAVWVYRCQDIVLQHNTSRHVRGPIDSYSYHIDIGNTNVLYQYNLSEDAEGGFVEILGLNKNVCYRYNVSINDGTRADANTLWVASWPGNSDGVYIYNNTAYVGGNQAPGIDMNGGTNINVFNNIFYVAPGSSIGATTNVKTGANISNNLFFGNVNAAFTSLSSNSFTGDPLFSSAGSVDGSGYTLKVGSPALNKGIGFSLPNFPKAGTGIFSGIPTNSAGLNQDFYGNTVNIAGPVHIGAY